MRSARCVYTGLVRALSWRLRAGVYNEEVFASLDWVLDQASRRNIRIIIPFEARACARTAVAAVMHVLAVAVAGPGGTARFGAAV